MRLAARCGMRPRTLFACVAICGAAACVGPGLPGLLQTPVTGEWTGTFESSWGTLPIKATLANTPHTQSFTGTYTLGGNRATGTIGGALETKAEDIPGFFMGDFTIAYTMADGQTCKSTSAPSVGSATAKSFSIESAGFKMGNCPDPPSAIRITLSR